MKKIEDMSTCEAFGHDWQVFHDLERPLLVACDQCDAKYKVHEEQIPQLQTRNNHV